jgi:3-oxoacyl-[acyl-carrier protein] reductase
VEFGLKGKVAVITGAGRGIGAETAAVLAAEGARVVVSDIDRGAANQTAEALRERGHEAIAKVCDVVDETQVHTMMAEAAVDFGSIDILVNNAGFAKDRLLLKMQESEWDSVLNTILKGTFRCCRAALPFMIERRWGRIVNVSSRSLFGNPGQTNYATAKAGIIGFTRSLALEQARHGITVNAIAPGFVETDGMRAIPNYEKLRAIAQEKVPVGFLGQPIDIAAPIAFLTSECARYISGTTLYVTGGRYSS